MEWIWIIVGVIAVLVLFTALGRSMRPKVPTVPSSIAPTAPTAPSAPTTPDASIRAEIDRLVAAENKIAAIKVYRDATGVSLQEAKNTIDRWSPAAPATTALPILPTESIELEPAVVAEIDRLVAADAKIEAIKLLREHTGAGLKESKDRIEAWVPGQG